MSLGKTNYENYMQEFNQDGVTPWSNLSDRTQQRWQTAAEQVVTDFYAQSIGLMMNLIINGKTKLKVNDERVPPTMMPQELADRQAGD